MPDGRIQGVARQAPHGLSFEKALLLGYVGRVSLRPYLDWLKKLPCDTCGAPPPSDPSHINNYSKGIGTKSPDPWAIPQCRRCHEEYERFGGDTDARLARAALYLLRAICEGRLVWQRKES